MRTEALDAQGTPDGTWTFITNHAAALLLIAEQPDIRLSDLADRIEITERAAQRLVKDLVDGGYVSVTKQGRRNCYAMTPDVHMRHPVVCAVQLRDLLSLVGGDVAR